MLDVLKVFCRVLQFLNTLQLANVYIGQCSKRYKRYITTIRDKILF